jgi:hypothetical protein
MTVPEGNLRKTERSAFADLVDRPRTAETCVRSVSLPLRRNLTLQQGAHL